jgi:hypothetical protein
LNSFGKFFEQFQSLLPRYAAVGDALAIGQWLPGNQPLCARDKAALDHHSDDALVSVGNLPDHIATNGLLLGVIAVAVGMAAIDHETRRELRFLQLPANLIDGIGGIVRSISSTS